MWEWGGHRLSFFCDTEGFEPHLASKLSRITIFAHEIEAFPGVKVEFLKEKSSKTPAYRREGP